MSPHACTQVRGRFELRPKRLSSRPPQRRIGPSRWRGLGGLVSAAGLLWCGGVGGREIGWSFGARRAQAVWAPCPATPAMVRAALFCARVGAPSRHFGAGLSKKWF